MDKIAHLGGGRKVVFQGFRGESPAAAIFSLERFEGGVFRVVDLLLVPIRFRPRSPEGARRTRSWAQRQVLAALEVV